jgi:hypothetical protein
MIAVLWGVNITLLYHYRRVWTSLHEITQKKRKSDFVLLNFFNSMRPLAVWKNKYTLVKFVPGATVSNTLPVGRFV